VSGLAAKRRRIKMNLLLRLVVLCFICTIATLLVQLQADIVRSRKQLEEIEILCEEQRIANKEVERMLQMGDDDDYIERVARAKSGYAYPDERIFYPISGK
jgi:cell division protein FtsB